MDNKYLRDTRNATVGIAELVLGYVGIEVASKAFEVIPKMDPISTGNQITEFVVNGVGIAALVAGAALLIKGCYDIGGCVIRDIREYYQEHFSKSKNPEH